MVQLWSCPQATWLLMAPLSVSLLAEIPRDWCKVGVAGSWE